MATGYTSIQIGEKTVGLKFAFLAIQLFTEASKKKIKLYFSDTGESDDSKSVLTIFGVAKLIQCAYINNCELKEAEPELNFENFYDWVEEVNDSDDGRTELSRVLQVYAESSYSKKLVAESEKKNQPTGNQEPVNQNQET